MRMWMLPQETMCNKHLLGEHGEIHKHRHVFVKGYSIAGRVSNKGIQIEPGSMDVRHDALAIEMAHRGMNHNSPYSQPDISYLPAPQRFAMVNKDLSAKELHSRCDKCRELFTKWEA